MRTLACSHKQGVIEDSNTFTEKNLDSLRDRFEMQFKMPWIDEPCILKADHASFHHALCFHGSGNNLTGSTPTIRCRALYAAWLRL